MVAVTKGSDLRVGVLYENGRRLYSVCPKCRSLVRLNKPLFGSLHVCAWPEVGNEVYLRNLVEMQRRALRSE